MRKLLILTVLSIWGSFTALCTETLTDFHNRIGKETNLQRLKSSAKKEWKAYHKNHQLSNLQRYNLVMSFIYARNGNINKRLHTLLWLEKNSAGSDEIRLIADYHIAYLLLNSEAFQISREYAFRALKKCPKYHPMYAPILTIVASGYYESGQFNKAKRYFSMAFHAFQQENLLLRASQLNNIGLCESKLKHFSSAKSYFGRGIFLLKSVKGYRAEQFTEIISGNLGSVYFLEQRYNLARKLLERELNYCKKYGGEKDQTLSPASQLLAIYAAIGYTAGQKEILNYLRHAADSLEYPGRYPDYSQQIYNHFVKTDNTREKSQSGSILLTKMNLHYKKNMSQQTELRDILFRNKIRYLNGSIRSQQQLFRQISNKKQLYLVLSFCAILSGLAGIYLVKKLYTNKHIIAHQKHLLLQNEHVLLQQENQLHQDQIAALAMYMHVRSQTENAFLEKLREIKRKKKTDTAEVVRELQFIINNIISIDRHIGRQTTKTNTFSKFCNQLKSKHPALTDEDIQLCCYFQMRLTSKQIAVIYSTSDGAIRVHKNKIKRKLELSQDESLDSYLMQFGN